MKDSYGVSLALEDGHEEAPDKAIAADEKDTHRTLTYQPRTRVYLLHYRSAFILQLLGLVVSD